MSKVTLNTIASRYGSLDALNDNFDQLEQAVENTLSRDGTGPNAMEANLDMNGNTILNVGALSVNSLSINGQNVVPTGTIVAPLPTQTGQSGRLLSTDGTTAFWQVPASSQFTFLQNGAAAQLRTVENKLRDFLSLSDFGAVGNGVADDTSAVQAAINAGNTQGKSVVVPPGTYNCGRLTVYSGTRLIGQNRERCVIRLRNGANTDLIYGEGSDALWGTNLKAGIDGLLLENLTLDGNRANNTSGCCVAIYGSRLDFRDLNIRNAPHHGMRTEWYQFGGDVPGDFGMEGHYERIIIDTSGRHGLWFKGPHDSVFVNVISIDASQETDNTWDGLRIDDYGNGRFVACHSWSRPIANVHRYALAITAGANEFANSHFEGAKTANVLIQSQRQQFTGCLFYAAKGSINIDVRSAQNIIQGILLDKFAGAPSSVGLRLGASAGDNVQGNVVDLIMSAQDGGAVNFTNSQGSNHITLRGFNPSGAAFVGTPHPLDFVNSLITGSSGLDVRKGSTFHGISAAGTTQGDATALGYSDVQNITAGASGAGVRLPAAFAGVTIHVHNNGANSLLVYPAAGEQINRLGTNNPMTLAAGRGAFVSSSTGSQWLAVIGS